MNVHVPTFPFHGDDDLASNFQTLIRKILQREAVIGVVGMGYVGLPLSEAFARRVSPCWASTWTPPAWRP
jgi:UDP-N-acetyl-D-glucosamine dehydrogenase